MAELSNPDILEVRRVADLVKSTQPRWANNLHAVCDLACALDHEIAECNRLRAEREVIVEHVDKMAADHVIKGSLGPLFDVGWAAACGAWARTFCALAAREQETTSPAPDTQP